MANITVTNGGDTGGRLDARGACRGLGRRHQRLSLPQRHHDRSRFVAGDFQERHDRGRSARLHDARRDRQWRRGQQQLFRRHHRCRRQRQDRRPDHCRRQCRGYGRQRGQGGSRHRRRYFRCRRAVAQRPPFSRTTPRPAAPAGTPASILVAVVAAPRQAASMSARQAASTFSPAIPSATIPPQAVTAEAAAPGRRFSPGITAAPVALGGFRASTAA